VLVQLVGLLRLQLLDVGLHIGRQRAPLRRRGCQLHPQPSRLIHPRLLRRLLRRLLLRLLLRSTRHLQWHCGIVPSTHAECIQMPPGADDHM
jgi:hypothetical protein